MNTGFSLLWSKILRSSLWVTESKETRLLWITMLAMKDSRGIIQSSVVGLADCAKISPDECRKSLKVLLSPDKDDTSGVEEGRRIREVPGGWEIINHDRYRFSTDEKREYWAKRKAEQRARERLKMTDKEVAAFEEGKLAEYRSRRKVTMVKKAKTDGQKSGSSQAMREGFEDQTSHS